jgi:hypothetical protein
MFEVIVTLNINFIYIQLSANFDTYVVSITVTGVFRHT